MVTSRAKTAGPIMGRKPRIVRKQRGPNRMEEISEELNSRLESNKTVEKCMKKMTYLIEKYKYAKEWNRKQTGGTRRQSIFYNEIDAILGCRDIVTLRKVSEAGTSGGSSPLNISHSSSADSPAGSDDLDAQTDKNELSQGDPKKDARDASTDRKRQSKQSRKRNRAAVEEGEEEERRELLESMDDFKKCGENLSNFMETFSETQKQQMAMMGQFIGAMTQFMSKNTESSPPKWTVKCIWHNPIFLARNWLCLKCSCSITMSFILSNLK